MNIIDAVRKLGASPWLDMRGPCHMVITQVVLDACSHFDAMATAVRL